MIQRHFTWVGKKPILIIQGKYPSMQIPEKTYKRSKKLYFTSYWRNGKWNMNLVFLFWWVLKKESTIISVLLNVRECVFSIASLTLVLGTKVSHRFGVGYRLEVGQKEDIVQRTKQGQGCWKWQRLFCSHHL